MVICAGKLTWILFIGLVARHATGLSCKYLIARSPATENYFLPESFSYSLMAFSTLLILSGGEESGENKVGSPFLNSTKKNSKIIEH